MDNQEKNTKLTSVKILKDFYLQFKKDTIDEKITLQQFVNRSLYLYIVDEDFRKKMNKYDTLKLVSGSYF